MSAQRELVVDRRSFRTIKKYNSMFYSSASSHLYTLSEAPNSYTKEYIAVIKSCFAKDTLANPYFYQLVDYIQSDGLIQSRMIPTPTVIGIRRSLDATRHPEDIRPWGFEIPFAHITQAHKPYLVTVQGLPSPGCVAHLGSQYGIRPEYWLGHLNLGRRGVTQDSFFELPSLPTRRDNIVQVPIPILGRGTGSSIPTHFRTMQRLEAKQRLQDWDRQLLQNKRYGATRLRKLHVHNSQFFSIEQLVSFSVSERDASSWIGNKFYTSACGDRTLTAM